MPDLDFRAVSGVDQPIPAGWLTLCHACDLPSRVGDVPEGGSARCPRCGTVLYRRIRDSLDRTLALAVAGMFLFIAANVFPFLAFKMQGNVTHTTLSTGVRALFEQGTPIVASLVLLTTIVAPLLQICSLIYVLAPLRAGIRVPGQTRVFRLLRAVQPWSMMEVFIIGILVSLVKLVGMAQIVPGIALWSFALLIPVLAFATSSLD
ncbi:MAG: paraquat-inducible protein A, partial [Deltaproteobacteria bacterium]|nr:paraquat-inducible protein A [Deltaproteobacteria bacterium]